jgi:hypothetical protein
MTLSEQLRSLAGSDLLVLDEAALVLEHQESRIQLLEQTLSFLLKHDQINPVSVPVVCGVLKNDQQGQDL